MSINYFESFQALNKPYIYLFQKIQGYTIRILRLGQFRWLIYGLEKNGLYIKFENCLKGKKAR